jgi:hypothetical protein
MEKIEKKYQEQININSDINEHIETLYKYGKECNHITEMGVRWVSSTWAFLLSSPKKLISYDIVKDNNINEIISISNEYNIPFEFYEKDVLSISIEPTELLFIDTLHTYNQLINELHLHSKNVSKYIILHDTVSFGNIDESVYNHASDLIKSINTSKQGLIVAISDFLDSDNRSDLIKSINTSKQGLIVAISDFLDSDNGKEWGIHKIFENNNGLTILKKI